MSNKQKIHVKVGDIVVVSSGFYKNEQEKFLSKELISN
jgi:hypothetical protein